MRFANHSPEGRGIREAAGGGGGIAERGVTGEETSLAPLTWPETSNATAKKVGKHRYGADSSVNNHPVCADSGCFAIFSLSAQPPLLARRGDSAILIPS